MNRKRSATWDYFQLDEVNKRAKCTLCLTKISYTKGNISNLARHVKNKHPGVSQERQDDPDDPIIVVNNNVPTPASSNLSLPSPSSAASNSTSTDVPTTQPLSNQPRPSTSGTTGRASHSQTKLSNYMRPFKVPEAMSKVVDREIVSMIVKEYRPLSIVDSPGFRKVLDAVSKCPGYKPPTRKTITESMIPSLYGKVKDEVIQKLSEVSSVCLTTDSWTSINTENFLAVTAHCVLNDELVGFLLDCVEYPERHTSVNLAGAIKAIAIEFGIEKKIVSVTTDNAPNIVGAIGLNEWAHIPCFAHSLNLVVQSSLKSNMQGTVTKIKNIVKHFKSSTHAMAKLRATISQMNLPELKLKQDVDTRWNSTFDMMDRFLKLKDAIISTMALLNIQNIEPLTSNDWLLTSQAVNILDIFNEITIEVSAEKSPTLSKVILYYNAIIKTLNNQARDMSHDAESLNLVFTLKDEMSKRFRNLHPLAAESTLMDPRFKKVPFKHDERGFNVASGRIKTQIMKKIREKETLLSNENSVASTSTTSCTTPSPNVHKQKIWDDFDSEIKRMTAQSNPQSASIVQLDKYIQEVNQPRAGNPLVWWKERKHIYPELYDIAMSRLCIPGTSVPCERIFSKAGLTMTDRRNRLKAKKLREIVFLNHNLPT
ncbi:hypothetical protein M8J76_016232 [Diaphorina citri]|nr:hypothetical protein M8J76_016232 [Diaphorina citri]